MSPPKKDKEVGLRDIADIVFTTLAFLSFGMFILQVLICLTMVRNYTIYYKKLHFIIRTNRKYTLQIIAVAKFKLKLIKNE